MTSFYWFILCYTHFPSFKFTLWEFQTVFLLYSFPSPHSSQIPPLLSLQLYVFLSPKKEKRKESTRNCGVQFVLAIFLTIGSALECGRSTQYHFTEEHWSSLLKQLSVIHEVPQLGAGLYAHFSFLLAFLSALMLCGVCACCHSLLYVHLENWKINLKIDHHLWLLQYFPLLFCIGPGALGEPSGLSTPKSQKGNSHLFLI